MVADVEGALLATSAASFLALLLRILWAGTAETGVMGPPDGAPSE
jgi:hypothetical protein